jgi:hypothetical protein
LLSVNTDFLYCQGIHAVLRPSYKKAFVLSALYHASPRLSILFFRFRHKNTEIQYLTKKKSLRFFRLFFYLQLHGFH